MYDVISVCSSDKIFQRNEISPDFSSSSCGSSGSTVACACREKSNKPLSDAEQAVVELDGKYGHEVLLLTVTDSRWTPLLSTFP